jgi:uncharacterized OB-fold protein
VHDGLFRRDPPALLGTRCDACGRFTFPRTDVCPYCGATATVAVDLSPTGTLWGWTTVVNPPPGYRGEVPFGFGIVELPEGVRVVTRLAVPDESYRDGLPVQLRIVPLHTDDDGDEVETWEFAP